MSQDSTQRTPPSFHPYRGTLGALLTPPAPRSPSPDAGSSYEAPIVVEDDDVIEVTPPPPLRRRAEVGRINLHRPVPPTPPPIRVPAVADEKKSKPKKSAWWVATYFSEEKADWDRLRYWAPLVTHLITGVGTNDWDETDPLYHRFALLRHLSWQLELCPDTGRTHAHVLFGYHQAVRMTAPQKLLGVKCHVERPINLERTFAYGVAETKDGEPKRAPADHFGGSGPFFVGVSVGGQGARNDLHALRLAVELGADEKTAVEHHTVAVARHMPFYKHIRTVYDKPQQRLVRVFWLYGPPRIGKNTVLRRLYPAAYVKTSGTAHW